MKNTIQTLDLISITATYAPSERSKERGYTKPYTTTVIGDQAYCDCPGFSWGHCKHGDTLLAVARELREQPATQPEIPLCERGTLVGTRPFDLLR